MKKVSIITLNYNGRNVMQTCVESVKKLCTSVDWEWVIGENGSTDGSLEYLESLKDPRIKIIKRKNDGNFSSMNNDVAKYATGEYLCFLNNDTEAQNDFLKEMLKVIEKDKDVGVVGAVLRYPNGELQSAGIVIDNNLSPVNVSIHSIRNRPIHKDLCQDDHEYQAVTGACFLMRKKDFDWVWGFDANYNWAYEDVDLCLKIKYHMLKKVVCASQAQVTHHESFSKANPNLVANFSLFKGRWQSVLDKDVEKYHKRDYKLYQKEYKVPELTFVICTHNLTMLNECVIQSLLAQENKNYDYRIIYNFDSRFTAPRALNYGLKESTTEFTVLCHHDVIFNPKWTIQFFKEAAKYHGFGVGGLAGVKRAERVPLGIPVDPSDNIYVNCYGEVTYPYKGNETHKYGQFSEGKVDIVDELCLILRKSSGLRFDEHTLTNFHFYGPDICLQATERGLFNVIFNCPAYHKSDGSTSLALGMDIYWKEFRKIHKKWKAKYPVVVTTTGFWNGEKIRTFIETDTHNERILDTSQANSKNVSPNIPVELTIGEAQKFQIANFLRGSQINWFVNGNKIPHDKDFYIFEAISKGITKLSVTYVDQSGRLTRYDWTVNTVTKPDNDVILGVQQNFHTHTFGEIVNDKVISQEFICDSDKLARIDLYIGTYQRKNSGNLCLAIKNGLNGDVLRYSMIPCEILADNDWNSFTFEPLDAKNKRLVISVETKDSIMNNAPTAYYVHHSFPVGSLYYNKRKIAGCLTFRLFYKK